MFDETFDGEQSFIQHFLLPPVSFNKEILGDFQLDDSLPGQLLIGKLPPETMAPSTIILR